MVSLFGNGQGMGQRARYSQVAGRDLHVRREVVVRSGVARVIYPSLGRRGHFLSKSSNSWYEVLSQLQVSASGTSSSAVSPRRLRACYHIVCLRASQPCSRQRSGQGLHCHGVQLLLAFRGPWSGAGRKGQSKARCACLEVVLESFVYINGTQLGVSCMETLGGVPKTVQPAQKGVLGQTCWLKR